MEEKFIDMKKKWQAYEAGGEKPADMEIKWVLQYAERMALDSERKAQSIVSIREHERERAIKAVESIKEMNLKPNQNIKNKVREDVKKQFEEALRIASGDQEGIVRAAKVFVINQVLTMAEARFWSELDIIYESIKEAIEGKEGYAITLGIQD
jgi:hypothetical protein